MTLVHSQGNAARLCLASVIVLEKPMVHAMKKLGSASAREPGKMPTAVHRNVANMDSCCLMDLVRVILIITLQLLGAYVIVWVAVCVALIFGALRMVVRKIHAHQML